MNIRIVPLPIDESLCTPLSITFIPFEIFYLYFVMDIYHVKMCRMKNAIDPDQTAPFGTADCSFRNSLIRAHSVCFHDKVSL